MFTAAHRRGRHHGLRCHQRRRQAEWTTPFESTLITALNRAELTRAFQSTTKAFLNELAPPLAERLSSALRALPAGLTLFH